MGYFRHRASVGRKIWDSPCWNCKPSQERIADIMVSCSRSRTVSWVPNTWCLKFHIQTRTLETWPKQILTTASVISLFVARLGEWLTTVRLKEPLCAMGLSLGTEDAEKRVGEKHTARLLASICGRQDGRQISPPIVAEVIALYSLCTFIPHLVGHHLYLFSLKTTFELLFKWC